MCFIGANEALHKNVNNIFRDISFCIENENLIKQFLYNVSIQKRTNRKGISNIFLRIYSRLV